MPTPETDYLFQKAVLWSATAGEIDDDNDQMVAAADEIDVRWENVDKQSIDPQGNVVAISASVVADQEIPIGSIMWLGKLKDIADPPVDLMEVITSKSIPDIKGRETRRTYGLARFSNTLPTLIS
jgi:hypothetical protein